MTLDEAIQHCKDNSKKECKLGNNDCAEEHDQLASWLIELQQYRMNK